MSKYIFGYGSLMNLRSLSKTIKREMLISDILPVKLLDYARVWNLKEKVFSEKLRRNITAIFLNIKPSVNRFVNGVIFKVSDNEFLYLQERERNYTRLNVTRKIITYDGLKIENLEIFVFISTEKKYIQKSQTSNCYVMEKYIQMVAEGCSEIGTYFLNDYKNTSSNNPFDRLEGNYTFVKTNDEGLH